MNVRPLDWRDFPLLHRVRDQGIALDSQTAFTRGNTILLTVLLDILTPGRTGCTMVARGDSDDPNAAIGQLLHRAGEAHARLSFVGPVRAVDSDSGAHLLDGLAQFAGQRGARHLIAEVDEDSPAFKSLRRAGFAIYARQRIWQLTETILPPPDPEEDPWRPAHSADEAAISSLYLNLVPGLVQQVEPPPTDHGPRLVYYQQGELLAFLAGASGPRGTWLQPFFHPALQSLRPLLRSALARYPVSPARPLHVAVRSYQAWLDDILNDLGFTPCAQQAVMVKHLAAAVRRPALGSLPQVNGRRAEPTTPFANYKNIP
jgi:hypothetical protein